MMDFNILHNYKIVGIVKKINIKKHLKIRICNFSELKCIIIYIPKLCSWKLYLICYSKYGYIPNGKLCSTSTLVINP